MMIRPLEDMKYRLPVVVNHGNLSIPYWRRKSGIEAALKNIALTFVASVGREGSGFVAEAFSGNKGLVSLHEPRPFCNGRRLIERCFSGKSVDGLVMRVKLSTIARSIVESGCSHYLESSHMFLKTFGRHLLREYDVAFNLISLRRPLLKTVASFHSLAYFGGRFNRAQNWVYRINESTPLTSRGLRLDCETDHILSYIISEKINEVDFLSSAGSSRINYVRLKIPPSMQNLRSVSDSIGLIGQVDHDLRKANTRERVKVGNVDSEALFLDAQEYFLKNGEALRKKSVNYCLEKNQITIGAEHWNIC